LLVPFRHLLRNAAGVDDILWGAAAIGKPIGRNARQTHHLLAALDPRITYSSLVRQPARAGA
jgi:hypothetical protein